MVWTWTVCDKRDPDERCILVKVCILHEYDVDVV